MKMWENRITLSFIKHEDARHKISLFLHENMLNDSCIEELNISTDSGYVLYQITTFDKKYLKCLIKDML